jgi:hypothetical protein
MTEHVGQTLSLEGCEMCLVDESSEILLLCWPNLYLRPAEALSKPLYLAQYAVVLVGSGTISQVVSSPVRQ